MILTIQIYSWKTDEEGKKVPKSYLLTGEEATKKYKDELKKMNGRFGKGFKKGGIDADTEEKVSGWIFGAKGWSKVDKWLKELKDPDLTVIKSFKD